MAAPARGDAHPARPDQGRCVTCCAMPSFPTTSPEIAVIGGGPAGLMAAEAAAREGAAVTVYDRMPSVGRKLLMAGRGGLNLTHSEETTAFLARYGPAQCWLEPAIAAFPPQALVAWAEALGQPTFTGSSGRVFPRAMKASPLLRAWLSRLHAQGIAFRARHRWTGWDDAGGLRFDTRDGAVVAHPAATILALGGASWPRLGSDGGWAGLFPADAVAPLRPANCGFQVAWTPVFRDRFAGHPLKRIALRFGDLVSRGEAMITRDGLEGGGIYALSSAMRDAIAREGHATLILDLRPDLTQPALARRLAAPRRGQSLSTFLRKQAGLSAEAIGLVQEALHGGADAARMDALIKALPLHLLAPAGLARAISTAGGMRAGAMDQRFMLRDRPGVFAAGEMLDWEAPTGGYLLQACFATGAAAGRGAVAWLRENGRM
ncbi:MAG: TIGR03862 family flavoprotein [Acetobacteraceae bacterium]